MRFFDLRVAVVCLLALCTFSLCGNAALAQTVTPVPASLAFGVPHGSTVSAEQTVTFSVTGSGSLTITISAPTSADFAITTNSCGSPVTAPGSCAVGITFTPHASEGTLETASFGYSTNNDTFLPVPLTGALGAIKIFDETDLGASNPSANNSQPFVYGNKTINLSCPAPTDPAGVVAVLSNTPDGVGNVLEDNFLTVAVGTGAASNVCPAGIADPVNDCFTHAYQNFAGGSQHNGTNTDSITNANNITGAPGGVSPINIASLFTFGSTATPVTFKLNDEGVIVAGSTLFLKTNCTPAGVQPGGSITGNPINPNNPVSLVPQFPLSTTQNQNIVFVADYTGITSNDQNSGATPTVTDIGISQADFSALVAGTHAAPAVCLRLSAEVDPNDSTKFLCKGFLIECTTTGNNTPSGSNCPQSLSDIELKFQAKFDSKDAPNDGTNYLPDGANPTGSACNFFLGGAAGKQCLPGTGPGLLEGNDAWFQKLTTPFCTFPSGDALSGATCPQNPITAFRGAQDPGHTVTTKNTNSIFIPVVNMPLPKDTVVVAGQTNGWVKTGTVAVTITANAATYAPGANNPLANGFNPVDVKTETYGIAPSTTALPDPNGGPVDGDTTKTNGAGCPGTPGTPFVSTDTFTESDGIYNLHHFPTDCAATEGLVYAPTAAQLTDPDANWASFPVTVIGVDTQAPAVTCPAADSSWHNTDQSVSCLASDTGYFAGQSGSGFAPAVNGIQGSQSQYFTLSTSVSTWNSFAPTNSTNACDIAGNCVAVGPVNGFKIDKVAPTVTVTFNPSNTAYQVGQSGVSVAFSCADVGSGIATCVGKLDNVVVSSPKSIDTSAAKVGGHTLVVTATDLAGNTFTKTSTYTVSYASADLQLAAGSLPAATVRTGTYITYGIIATNHGPSTAQSVAFTDTLPAGATFNSGYTLNGLKLTSCSSSGGVVTCPVGNLGNGGIVLAYITIKVPSTPGTVTNTIVIGGLNPDPKPSNNSVTVNTKVTK